MFRVLLLCAVFGMVESLGFENQASYLQHLQRVSKLPAGINSKPTESLIIQKKTVKNLVSRFFGRLDSLFISSF